MEGFPGQSSGLSAYSAEVQTPVSSLTPSGKFAIASQLISQLADLIEGPPEKFEKRIAVLRDIKAAWGENREVVVVPQDTSYATLQAFDSSCASEFAVKREPQQAGMPRIESVVGYGQHPVERADSVDRTLLHESDNESGSFLASPSKTEDRLNTSSMFEDLGKQRIQVNLQKIDIGESGSTLALDIQDALTDKLGADDSEAEESYHDAASEFQGDQAADDPSSSPPHHVKGGPGDDKDTSLDKAARTTQCSSKTSPLKAENKRTSLVCKKCGLGFQLGASSTDRPFACPHCQQSPSKPRPRLGAAAASSQFENSNETPRAIGNHNASKKTDRPFPCPLCPKRFKAHAHLNDHIRRHNRDKPFSCGTCGKTFYTKSNRNRHEKTHSGQTNPESGEQVPSSRLSSIAPFGFSSNLKKDLKTSKVKRQNNREVIMGTPQSTSDTCDVHLARDKDAASLSAADAHQTSIGKDQRYPCDICDVTFSTKTRLTSHRNSHCKCQTCGIQFPTRGDLRLHEKIHSSNKVSSLCHITSEKSRPVFGPEGIRKKYERIRKSRKTKESYTCSVCNKVLQTIKDLRRHQQTHTNERPHVCRVCSKRLRTASNLRVHMRIHTDERPFKCKLCPMRFRQGSHLNFHWRSVHGKNVLKCSMCPKTFLDLEEHRHHEWVRHQIQKGRSPVGRDLFGNVIAEATSGSSKGLNGSKGKEKQNATSSGDPWPCNECGKIFPTEAELQTHCKVHVTTGSHQCTQCLKIFSSKPNLCRHVSLSHMKSHAFNCDICGKKFVHEGMLKQHRAIHFRETESNSLASGVSRTRKVPAASTQTEAANSSQKCKVSKGAHQCPLCQKMLSSKSSLTDHMRNHTNERPYPCRLCGKLFKQRGSRRIHEVLHAKNFNCSVCHSPFSTRVALVEHLLVEHKQRGSPDKSGKQGSTSAAVNAQKKDKLAPTDTIQGNLGKAHLPKSFTGVPKAVSQGKHCCRFCGKSLSSRTRLLCHEKRHTDKQSLTCNICKEMFRSTGSLMVHMQTHQKKNVATSDVTLHPRARLVTAGKKKPLQAKKKFQCKYCEKLLNSKSHLVEHERIHTGERPFHCDVCQASFTTKSSLTSHQKRRHLQSPYKKTAHQSRSPKSQVANANTSHSPKAPSTSTSHSPKVANANTSNSHHRPIPRRSQSPRVANVSKSDSPKVANANRTHSPKAANASSSHSRQIVNARRSPVPQAVSTNSSHTHQVSNSYASHSPIKSISNVGTMRRVANGTQGRQATKLNSIAKHKGSPHKERECLFDPESNQKISQCQICGQVFASSKKLAVHEKGHASKSTSEVEDSYSFSEKTSSKDKASPAEKIYKCSYCEKTGKRLRDMIQHEMRHTGERPFDCNCGKTFVSKSSLGAHMRNSCRLTKQTDSML